MYSINSVIGVIYFVSISLCFTAVGAQSQDTHNSDYTFEAMAAPEWTALFERDSGWFGADGIFSIPLDGTEVKNDESKNTLFIFSDTYIGEVKDGKPLPGNKMVNNTTAVLKGLLPRERHIEFKYKTNIAGEPTSYFIPNNKNSVSGEYYWLGDGFINKEADNNLYIFGYHVHKTGPNVFDFEQTNISILKIPYHKSGMSHYEQIPTELGIVHPEHGRVYFGSGILVNTEWSGVPNPDGWIYIYGLMGENKSLIAARVRPSEFENTGKWVFWTGSNWSNDIQDVTPITDAISNELSVTPTEYGDYFLTFQVFGISDKVGIQVGASPVGPFGPINEVFTTPEYASGLLPYNAKAHYHLSKPGELLVSYNTITFDFWKDIQEDASIYHPRFVKVKYRKKEK